MEKQGGRAIDSILGDALEALIGAVYLDTERNMQKTQKVVEKLFKPYILSQIDLYQEDIPEIDPKNPLKFDRNIALKRVLLRGTKSKRGLLDPIDSSSIGKNCRVRLQEFLIGVIYLCIDTKNIGTHIPIFTYAVNYDGVTIGIGSSGSKADAKECAA